MNDIPSSLTPSTAAPALSDPAPAPSPRAGRLARLLGPAALVLAAAALAVSVFAYQRISRNEQQLVRRLQAIETAHHDLTAQLKLAQDIAREVQGRNAVIEARLSESVGQQAQLERLYREMTRNRDDRTIADVENAVASAAQQLQLTGNVRGALLALQEADARLAGANQPPLIGLRRVLTRDIERLRAMPTVDPAGQAIRLDSVISSIDQLPMLSDAKLEPEPRPQTALPADGSLRSRIAQITGASWASVLDELTELVRIRRVDSPDTLLLAPQQAYFIRENLKLRLTAARTALLARQEAAYRADLSRAIEVLERDFDVRNRQVLSTVLLLKGLRDSTAKLELPLLTESLAAVRQLRARDVP